ncbi:MULTISPECIES: anhydro-N-acetylmuramic acid kinase [unclassified Luteimonas]|uniref:anhydro-N-acetylmuramic acid kinase n=1 Tax=unclassified Luteimonas TaxID=2629088 RepID=UPI00160313EE|nr:MULTISPECIES: anhydro-N-acetylmuramic acid kinase [unclassified Luteimonas]MBB1473112.1 anhydro-N-acetylmuramic acid kinase [Luteimonas sp. MC1782]MBB6598184.1 anhydro-N-acetylmuramic acid kinase [Luteimonas sp. MC1825]QOC88409.1 anhydro-N-acetylmuramic acid kinase [Luteimonas sp. MC1825]
MSTPRCHLGLISGTSADGIDAALVDFADDTAAAPPRLRFARTYAWEPALRARLVALGQQDALLSLDAIGELDTAIGQAFATAALQALADAGIDHAEVAAIGSHGQTLRHRPHGALPFTLQLGCAATIAERTGITTVADFRRRDVAAGGHGAPLVPALHAALLHSADESRAVLNLGGIANLTLLPASGAVRGFDTGPANGLMDAWCLRHRSEAYDRDGAFAASGRVDDALLARLLAEPWFALAPPKSTGRDQFHLGWVEARLATGTAPADVQATLLALTARTVADALRSQQPGTARVIACGGGVHNAALMAALAAALPDMRVETTAAYGLDPDAIEAMAFAWLARETLAGRPGNLASVTGAAGPRILGAIHRA